MPFEQTNNAPKSIAIIGGGISGMGAAYKLAPTNRVVLFEAEAQIGGHARTRRVGNDTVDTGFIVFNYANYPNMTALFDELDVQVEKSDMSFGASINGGAFEYGLAGVGAVFAQKRNILRPAYWRMIRDVIHFNKYALEASKEPGLTVSGLMDKLGMGRLFRKYYLLPLSGAIWSTPIEKIGDFPAYAMLQFFENHALLHHTGQHQWYTVTGGSRQYVDKLEAALIGRGVDIRVQAPVQAVHRQADGVQVVSHDGSSEHFDEVIFATHTDVTLSLLADPTEQEAEIFNNFKYQPNKVVLHTDASIMPKRRAIWSSWNYTEADGKATDQIDLTYWMNSLQPWLKGEDIFVTLNSTRQIDPSKIYDEVTLHHPVYDEAALDAQRLAAQINGENNTWFCGAWMKNGFHEDGLSSAYDVADAILSRATELTVAAE